MYSGFTLEMILRHATQLSVSVSKPRESAHFPILTSDSDVKYICDVFAWIKGARRVNVCHMREAPTTIITTSRWVIMGKRFSNFFFKTLSLLGLMAKIKCSICSYQFNIWYAGYMPAQILIWFLVLGQGSEVYLTLTTGCLGVALLSMAAYFI